MQEISVLMSVQNGESYIKNSIESVLNQTFSNFEFLIIDDASSDNTLNIISEYKDSRIKIFKNKKNIGLTASLNKLLSESKGKYIARIDADDCFYPDKLQLQLNFFEKNNNFGMCASCCEVIDESNNLLYPMCPYTNEKLLKWNLIFRNNIRHSTVMWRKELNKKYNEKYLQTQDYELWCRMVRDGIRIGIVLEKTTKIRSTENSVSNKYSASQEAFACLVTKEQAEFYLNKEINFDEAKNLRLLNCQKCASQAEEFNLISTIKFKEAIRLYLDLAILFFQKEEIDQNELINQIEGDFNSIFNDIDKKNMTLMEILNWKNKNDFAKNILKKFIKIKI